VTLVLLAARRTMKRQLGLRRLSYLPVRPAVGPMDHHALSAHGSKSAASSTVAQGPSSVRAWPGVGVAAESDAAGSTAAPADLSPHGSSAAASSGVVHGASV
jgi:hypothetical protein